MANKFPAIIKFGYCDFRESHQVIKDKVKFKTHAKCNICKEPITETKGTTSSYTRNYSNVHPEKHAEYVAQKHINFNRKQIIIDTFFTKQNSSYESQHPDQIKITDSLVANLIVGCSLLLFLVENSNFRKLICDMKNKYVLPSRSHLTSQLIPEAVKEKRELISKQVQSIGHIAMTVDIWTDRRMHSYLACTGHYFSDGKLQNFFFGFRPVKGRHNGQLIADELNNIIEQNQIRTKLGCVVTDNASNMKKAFDVLSELQANESEDESRHIVIVDDEEMWNDLHEEDQLIVNEAIEQHATERLACYAHSLQLCVKDGLTHLKTANSLLAKCSKLANLTHQSTLFRGNFESKFGKGRFIPKTNATRWNSMFVQLSSIIRLDPVKLSDLLRGDHSNLILTQREMAMLRELVEVLQPFAEATDLLQGDSYPTIGCIVPSVVGLHKCLNTLSSTIKNHIPLVNGLLSSLCDRFGGLLQNVKTLPTVLNFDCFVFMLYVENIDFSALITAEVSAIIVKSQTTQDLLAPSTQNLLPLTVEEEEPQEQLDQNGGASSDVTLSCKRKSTLFASYTKRRQRIEMRQQNNVPLSPTTIATAFMEKMVSIASSTYGEEAWVKAQSAKYYNIMNPLIEKLFCIPASSAPVERVFSQVDLNMRPNRARLGDEMLSSLVYLKCNSDV
ncbi:uncharacterized protein LOC136094083 [Hydra vulgaris]|uniref:uncharacterized protein LOC136094083 n=1 Tax=Hydra vulgaris TaxID=6087 RepID=UPI0032E9CEA9